MARQQYEVRNQYLGLGNVKTYSFDFKLQVLTHLLIVMIDDEGVIVDTVRGNDNTIIDVVTFNPLSDAGGTITLLANLPLDYKLVLLLADDAPTQPYTYGTKRELNLKELERSLDFLNGQIQRLAYLQSRSIQFDEIIDDPQNVVNLIPGGVIVVDEDGLGVTTLPKGAFAGPPGIQGNPWFVGTGDPNVNPPTGPTPNDGDIYADETGALWQYLAGVWTLTGEQLPIGGNATAVGYSQRYGEAVNLLTTQDIVDYIFNFGYVASSITLSGSSNVLREKGASVSNPTLTAVVTKRSDPIAAVRFYDGVTLINTVSSPNPAGGSFPFVTSVTFSDNRTFGAQSDDDGTSGGPTTSNASTTYNFVYPYYYGVGVAGLNAAAIAALTKDIINSNATLLRSFTIAGPTDRMYFAYPTAYGALVTIIDVNNFDVIGDWTRTTKAITGLDGNAVNYYCYEFNNVQTNGVYAYTFKR